jgi:hypothetical protein
MPRATLKLLLLAVGAFMLAGCVSHCCRRYDSVELVSPAPQYSDSVPVGYAQCTVVPAGWRGTYWMPEHRICRYVAHRETVWVGSYWRCESYQAQTGCQDWRWIPGHWTASTVLY